ncbi:MAG: metallophosphoesterase [Candidatus Aenigmarchaeota archaeon]|nr:metallophosphoesterase [Candidatus Aenigmarchaeota archaeon]
MLILAIGDIHGNDFPELKELVESMSVDAVFCTGDLCDVDILRRFIFSNPVLASLGFTLADLIGAEEYRKIIMHSIESQNRIIKRFGSLNCPVFLVYGNNDYLDDDIRSYNKRHNLKIESLQDKVKHYKNIKLLCGELVKFKELDIIGVSGYISPSALDKKKQDEFYKHLESLFKMAKNPVIFLTHEPPENILDRVRLEISSAYNMNIGNPVYNRIIKNFSPVLHLCGHIHEARGRILYKGTHVVNLGTIDQGYELIEIKGSNVKFLE